MNWMCIVHGEIQVKNNPLIYISLNKQTNMVTKKTTTTTKNENAGAKRKIERVKTASILIKLVVKLAECII